MNHLREFGAVLGRIDKVCARLNAGLSAFASVLTAVVIVAGAIRASEIAIDLSDRAAAVYSSTSSTQTPVSFWTYD